MNKKEELKSQATRIETLFKKQKALISSQKTTSNFKEPVMILMRKNRKAEFYENATTGRFEYIHSNGEDMYITLDRHFLVTFPYGNKEFIGYICHEDYPYPMPHDALITAEMNKVKEEKLLNDYRKWTSIELKAKGDMWWKILLGIAIVLVAYGIIKLLLPSAPTEQVVAQAGETIVRNITLMP